MERRDPDYEDEKLRFWSERKEEPLRSVEDDPTVLSVDLAREEIFESRVYNLRREAVAAIAADLIADRPDIPPEGILVTYMETANDSSFRIFAKREKAEQLLTWVFIGVFGNRRALFDRHEREPESVYREFVAGFEGDALTDGVVEPPTVITIDEWRGYEQQQRPSGAPS
jgi:hypothetical protein